MEEQKEDFYDIFQEQPEYKVCHEGHSVQFYCLDDLCYICEPCQIHSHFGHRLETLEVKCWEKYAETKQMFSSVGRSLKEGLFLKESTNTDEILSSIHKKMMDIQNELIEHIKLYFEQKMNNLLQEFDVSGILNEIHTFQTDTMITLEEDLRIFINTINDLNEQQNYFAVFKKYEQKIPSFQTRFAQNTLVNSERLMNLCKKLKEFKIELKFEEFYLEKMIHMQISEDWKNDSIVYYFNEMTENLCIYDPFKQQTIVESLYLDSKLDKHFGTCKCGPCIYFAGGNWNFPSREAFKIDLEKKPHSLVPISNMCFSKVNTSLCALNRKTIYSIGGFESGSPLATCEKYNTLDDTWRSIPALCEKRRTPTVCPIESRYIYVFAGTYDGSKYAMSIEFLDTLTDKEGWKMLDIKDTSWLNFYGAGSIYLGRKKVLIIGGYSGSARNNCFVLDMNTKEVTEISPLPKRDWFWKRQALLMHNKVYVFGYDTKELFVYNIAEDLWAIGGTKTIDEKPNQKNHSHLVDEI